MMVELSSQARELSSQNLETQSTLRTTLQVSHLSAQERRREQECEGFVLVSVRLFSVRGARAGGFTYRITGVNAGTQILNFCAIPCRVPTQTPKG